MSKRDAFALTFAMIFPTVSAWAYFQAAPSASLNEPPHNSDKSVGQAAVQIIYAGAKVLQFAFPLLWVLCVELMWVKPRPFTLSGLALGAGFGLLVAGSGLALYYGYLRQSSLFGATPAAIEEKLISFGADTPARYLIFTAFLSIVHSLLEEYYWRWFTYSRLRKHLAFWAALVLSSFAFTAHHVVLLYAFFPGRFLQVVLPMSLCVAVGGMVWAWLYERSGSIYAPWVSHLLIDAGIFLVGYDLVFIRG